MDKKEVEKIVRAEFPIKKSIPIDIQLAIDFIEHANLGHDARSLVWAKFAEDFQLARAIARERSLTFDAITSFSRTPGTMDFPLSSIRFEFNAKKSPPGEKSQKAASKTKVVWE